MVSPYRYSFELGLTQVGILNVESVSTLNKPPFPWTYVAGSERHTMGNGNEYVEGYPTVTWVFEFLDHAQWQWLEGLFTGTNQSVDVYIRTKADDDEFYLYTAVMHRPEIGKDANRGVGGFFDVTVRFTRLAIVAEE